VTIGRTLIAASVIALSTLATRQLVAQQFPMLDQLANHVIQKYQTASCDQLWQQKEAPKPKSPAEEKLVGLLRTDAKMREEFINRISGPVMNKMFECGMIP
jgi:hypothetical protein